MLMQPPTQLPACKPPPRLLDHTPATNIWALETSSCSLVGPMAVYVEYIDPFPSTYSALTRGVD